MSPNRWRIPIGAVAVHICIGSVYAWSTFNRPIQALFPVSLVIMLLAFVFTLWIPARELRGRIEVPGGDGTPAVA